MKKYVLLPITEYNFLKKAAAPKVHHSKPVPTTEPDPPPTHIHPEPTSVSTTPIEPVKPATSATTHTVTVTSEPHPVNTPHLNAIDNLPVLPKSFSKPQSPSKFHLTAIRKLIEHSSKERSKQQRIHSDAKATGLKSTAASIGKTKLLKYGQTQ
jgi:hypothetical protein